MHYLVEAARSCAQMMPCSDILEVLFFVSAVYYVQLWLERDDQRSLLLYFYGYCGLFFTSYYLDLPVVKFVLFVFAPPIFMLFIILHQEALQKNFITLRKPAQLDREETTWIDELVMSCLTALNRNKDIVLVLERNDVLKNLIHAPYFIYAELKRDVFDILLEKQIANNDKMIWINQNGKIVSINSSWKTHIDEEWLSADTEHLQPWKQQALYMSSKTDALVLKINPLSRSFDIVAHGSVIENLNAETITAYLKKQLGKGDRAVIRPATESHARKVL